MIYLKLFFVFLKIGAVSFGGGYGMISLVRESVISNNWLSESEFLSFVAVSESTPGPLAVNMATFVGSSQAGLPGALAATIGVVLPAFIIIMIIAAVISNLLKYAPAAFLSGVRPCVVGLIIATAITMAISTMLGIDVIGDKCSINIEGVTMFVIIAALDFAVKKIKKQNLSPILLIVISAVLGIVINIV